MKSLNRVNNMNNLATKNRMKSKKTGEDLFLAVEWE